MRSWMGGFLIGSGAIEVNHHWLGEIGLHSGWVGLASLVLGAVISILVTMKDRQGGGS